MKQTNGRIEPFFNRLAAHVGAFVKVHVVFSGVGTFGSFLADNKVFFRRKLSFPFLFGFFNREGGVVGVAHSRIGFLALTSSEEQGGGEYVEYLFHIGE